MLKDKRYIEANQKIANGKITRFQQLFKAIPKNIVFRDMRYYRPHFINKEFDMERLILRDIIILSDLFEITFEKMFLLIDNQRVEDKQI